MDVAITAYRRATFLGNAIESVLAQSLGTWSLTICESGPESAEIARVVEPYLSDARVRYAPSADAATLAENWTRAIGTGSARYVTILNDDERWHPDFLRRRVDILDRNPECAFAFAPWILIDEHGAEADRARPGFREGVVGQAELGRQLVGANPIVGCTTLVRRSAYEAVGPSFDEAWLYCDWEMWARLVSRFPAYYVAVHDSDFRRHPLANSFVSREEPDRLVQMVEHVERLLGSGVENLSLSRRQRARNRSSVLLRAAFNAHQGGGWTRSAELYVRAVRMYPPSALTYVSLSMIGKSLLGQRGSRAVGRALRALRPRRGTAPVS